MVLLTVTAAAKVAIDEYCQREHPTILGDDAEDTSTPCFKRCHTEIGGPIEHQELIDISKYLQSRVDNSQELAVDEAKAWRLDTLLRGANVYYAPPPTKPEPTPEYKALMRRLREDEERRQYDRMVNPVHHAGTFQPQSSSAKPVISHGYDGPDEIDEMTYADVNRQMILIINVLVSIICCSVAIWVVARRWSVPQRLGLSMTGSGLVAAAEVAIYMGYIGRLQSAKEKEVKAVEVKEVIQTWVIDKSAPSTEESDVRFRKGKHR